MKKSCIGRVVGAKSYSLRPQWYSKITLQNTQEDKLQTPQEALDMKGAFLVFSGRNLFYLGEFRPNMAFITRHDVSSLLHLQWAPRRGKEHDCEPWVVHVQPWVVHGHYQLNNKRQRNIRLSCHFIVLQNHYIGNFQFGRRKQLRYWPPFSPIDSFL
jgi:hypothetical protein